MSVKKAAHLRGEEEGLDEEFSGAGSSLGDAIIRISSRGGKGYTRPEPWPAPDG